MPVFAGTPEQAPEKRSFAGEPAEKPSLLSDALSLKSYRNIPKDIAEDFKAGSKTLRESAERTAEKSHKGESMGLMENVAGLSGLMQEMFSPVTGTARALVGDPLREALPKTFAGKFTANLGEDVATMFGPSAISKSLTTASKMLPSYSAAVQRLLDEGVTLTPGQIAHRWAKGIMKGAEDSVRSTPVVGNFMASAQYKSIEDFNRAVLNKALAPIGEKLPKHIEMGPQAIGYAEKILGQKYDALLPKLTLTLDKQYVNDLAQIGANATRRLPPAQRQQLSAVLNDIHARMPTATAPGDVYKQIETELNYIHRMYSRASDPAQRAFSDTINDLRGAFKDALERSNPKYAGELQELNSAWAAFSRAQGASIRRVKSNGVFSPADLLADIKANSSRGTFARGNGLLQDLASAGDQVLPSTVPDSGTAGRVLWADMLAGLTGGGAAIGVHAPMALGAGALPYTRAGMAGINAAARGIPKAAGAATRTIGESAPVTGPAAAVTQEVKRDEQ
jgi:hypothetical protein